MAYVACNEAGLKAVDVSDPGNPMQVGTLDTPNLAQAVAMAVVIGALAIVVRNQSQGVPAPRTAD